MPGQFYFLSQLPCVWICFSERDESSLRCALAVRPSGIDFSSVYSRLQSVRAKEGPGCPAPLTISERCPSDLTGRRVGEWHMRASTFRSREKQLLQRSNVPSASFDVLDLLGPGMGMACLHRLAQPWHLPGGCRSAREDTTVAAAARAIILSQRGTSILALSRPKWMPSVHPAQSMW